MIHVPVTPIRSITAATTPTIAPNERCELAATISVVGPEVAVELGVTMGRVTIVVMEKDCVSVLILVLLKVLLCEKVVEVGDGTKVDVTS